MVSAPSARPDVIGMVEDDLEAAFQVFFVRKGRVTGRKGFIVDKVEDLDRPELIARFLERLYSDSEIPKQVLVPVEPADKDAPGAVAEDRARESKVEISVPQTRREASAARDRHRERQGGLHPASTEAIAATSTPARVNCASCRRRSGWTKRRCASSAFDISNTGTDRGRRLDGRLRGRAAEAVRLPQVRDQVDAGSGRRRDDGRGDPADGSPDT